MYFFISVGKFVVNLNVQICHVVWEHVSACLEHKCALNLQTDIETKNLQPFKNNTPELHQKKKM